jgi:hypothetical protein
MELRLMEFHGILWYIPWKIPWNSKEFREFTEFRGIRFRQGCNHRRANVEQNTFMYSLTVYFLVGGL